jgi:hypothetical protein
MTVFLNDPRFEGAKEDWKLRPTNVGNQPLLHTSLHFTSLHKI